MTYTLEELERRAYIEGDKEKAALYALVIDQRKEIEELEEELFNEY